MATIDGIIEKIRETNPEIQPVPQTVVKNTIAMQGLCMKKEGSSIAPCIYIDEILASDISDEEAAAQILEIYNQADMDIDPLIFMDKEFVLNNIYLGLQRKDDDCKYLTRESPWDGIIAYMYIRSEAEDGSGCSVKVTERILECAGIDVSLAWSTAEKATCSEIDIKSLLEIFGELDDLGIDVDEDMDKESCEPPLYVASNRIRLNGAAVALNEEYIKNWAEEHSYNKIVLIFSSVHEVLILPADDNTDLNKISAMIQDVNNTQVKAVEQLADRAYIINFDTDTSTI